MTSESEREPMSEALRGRVVRRSRYLRRIVVREKPHRACFFRGFCFCDRAPFQFRCFLFLLDDSAAPKSRSSLSRAGHDELILAFLSEAEFSCFSPNKKPRSQVAFKMAFF